MCAVYAPSIYWKNSALPSAGLELMGNHWGRLQLNLNAIQCRLVPVVNHHT